MVPPRITKSGLEVMALEVMAFIPGLIDLPHHGLSPDAVNRRE
jgi:hypothetical protein